MMEELLEELNKLWNASDDERLKGENPACIGVLESIEEEFNNMSDDEIKEILDIFPEGQIEQLVSIFEDMVDERGFMQDYIL